MLKDLHELHANSTRDYYKGMPCTLDEKEDPIRCFGCLKNMQGDASRCFHMTYQKIIVFQLFLSFFRALTALASLSLSAWFSGVFGIFFLEGSDIVFHGACPQKLLLPRC